MSHTVEFNQGEIRVNFQEPTAGKISFADLGFKNEDLVFEGGLVRIVFDFEGIGKHHYYQVPTIELAYKSDMPETHWQCDFNDETILDKSDNRGRATVILLNRNKLSELEHHHQNKLIVHGEFSMTAHLLADSSFIHLFN